MNDVLQVSYTGDLLAHRRCPRAWAYEKHAQFHPYEQVQAMEGRLIHHAMEWLTRCYRQNQIHAKRAELEIQLNKYFRVLWAHGIRTTFQSKAETIERVLKNLFPRRRMHPAVKAAVEGATHTEYELRTVRKLIAADFGGKSKLMLMGILDLVVQSNQPLRYSRTWEWTDEDQLRGRVARRITQAQVSETEIWEYKGTQANSPYLSDFILQLLTYASLFRERTGHLPVRCVLFFVNERTQQEQLVAVPITKKIVRLAERWTFEQVRELRRTALQFEHNPNQVDGGDLARRHRPLNQRVDDELKKQCTACGQRFDCQAYIARLGGKNHRDVSVVNVDKN